MSRRDDHPQPEECGDADCPRYGCVKYKQGWRDGFDEGYAEGYAEGLADQEPQIITVTVSEH